MSLEKLQIPEMKPMKTDRQIWWPTILDKATARNSVEENGASVGGGGNKSMNWLILSNKIGGLASGQSTLAMHSYFGWHHTPYSFRTSNLHAKMKLHVRIGCCLNCECLSVCWTISQSLPYVTNPKCSEVWRYKPIFHWDRFIWLVHLVISSMYGTCERLVQGNWQCGRIMWTTSWQNAPIMHIL